MKLKICSDFVIYNYTLFQIMFKPWWQQDLFSTVLPQYKIKVSPKTKQKHQGISATEYWFYLTYL